MLFRSICVHHFPPELVDQSITSLPVHFENILPVKFCVCFSITYSNMWYHVLKGNFQHAKDETLFYVVLAPSVSKRLAALQEA